MLFCKRVRNGYGAPPVYANPQKSLLGPPVVFGIAALLLALPACRLAAHPGEEGRTTNNTVNLADDTAVDDTKIANPLTVAQPAEINSAVDTNDTEARNVAPDTSSPDTFEPVGALTLLSIAGEPAPVRPCFLVLHGLCEAVRNKPIVVVATIQTAALIADGVTTRQYLKRGYVEVDPLTRIFIGRKPTWARMAPLGALQVLGGMWLAERMETSRHSWVRHLWWLPQAVGIAGNTWATANNVRLH